MSGWYSVLGSINRSIAYHSFSEFIFGEETASHDPKFGDKR